MVTQKVLQKLPGAKSLREYGEFDNHEMVVVLTDESSGLKGYIGIHSTKLGPALGGTRVQRYKSEADAIHDVLDLSRAMSFKCALAGLPYGGGKGVIFLEDNLSYSREDVLAAYARMVDNLRGLFKTGTDVGVTDEDVAHMARYTSHMLGVTEADRGNLSTSSCAALGVFYAMKSAFKLLDGSDSFINKRIAIKGVGKLGGELARLVHEAGAKVIIADTNDQNINNVTEAIQGVEVVDSTVIHQEAVDIYAPCALGSEFSDSVIKKLNCRAVVGGANNQLPNIRAGHKLYARKILYAPDYIANSGGLIYVADELEQGGFSKERVLERITKIEQTMTDIFERSTKTGVPTSEIADRIGKERMNIT